MTINHGRQEEFFRATATIDIFFQKGLSRSEGFSLESMMIQMMNDDDDAMQPMMEPIATQKRVI